MRTHPPVPVPISTCVICWPAPVYYPPWAPQLTLCLQSPYVCFMGTGPSPPQAVHRVNSPVNAWSCDGTVPCQVCVGSWDKYQTTNTVIKHTDPCFFNYLMEKSYEGPIFYVYIRIWMEQNITKFNLVELRIHHWALTTLAQNISRYKNLLLRNYS